MLPLLRLALIPGLILWLLNTTIAVAAILDEPGTASLYQRGDFEYAVLEWDQSVNDLASPADRLQSLMGKAEALRALGMYPQAATTLSDAMELASRMQDNAALAGVLNGLGSIALATNRQAEAKKHLDAALELAKKTARHDLLASILNNFGNLKSAQEQYQEALVTYELAAEHARQAGQPLLHAQALSNAARAAASANDFKRAHMHAKEAQGLASALKNSQDKAFLLLSLGQFYSRQSPPDSLPLAHQALSEALAVADAIGDARSRSRALGYLAQLYARQGRDEEALELGRRAIAALQQINAPEIAYRWYWQQGRLKKKQGKFDAAISDYRMAVYHLQSIRADMPVVSASGKSSFREVLGPLYFELADLLLQRAAAATDQELKQSLLKEARNTIELSKAAELQDYFQDRCVAAQQQSKAGKTTVIGAGVAVIYPILLPDRLELLVDFSDGIVQFTSPVSSSRAVETIRHFRAKLEKRTTREYLPYGQELYDWLIRPLEKEFAARDVKTLIFVPDGALRTIPMAALHDGKEFLVARYAIATTPSLALTDTQSESAAKSPRALLNGLTQAVQGFSDLPNVAAELQTIGQLYSNKTLKDQDYVVDNIEQELDQTPYSVVHIASHGQFQSDVRESFLLAYDGKLTMDNLEKLISPSRYRDQPISLLTLSACQTAAGDDRAALGLAGVAVKAGARSALASLWFINDQSASMLVSEFYRQLHEPGMTKANALQNAQLKLQTDKRFSHPSYWSPFLLIGNWL